MTAAGSSVPTMNRFKRAHPCPICGGGDDMPRGHGKRCGGYLSSDGRFAYCTREEHAGQAALELTDPPSYRHILEGDCRCGFVHSPARDELLATYDYVDADGTLLYQVVRQAGKRFLQRRPDGHGGWEWKLGDTRRVLYRLPDVLKAALAGRTVYVVEGEKDVHAVEKTGAVATCNPGGAGKWRPEYADALAGATVVIVADNDEPGLQHARQIAETLPAAATTLVHSPTGKDVSDHLAAGHTLAELVPVEPNGAPPAMPAVQGVFETLRLFLKRELPKSESLIGAARNSTNLLPRYGWVMPWGREGSGKTSVLVDLLFHAAAGIPWLHYPVARPIKIVAIVNEGVPGGFQDKLQQKTELWDGDLNLVLDNLAIYVSPWGEFTFRNPQLVEHARAYVRDFQADYVALDPLHTLGTSGAGSPQETEEFKHLLRSFGLWDDIGIITAHHSNKNGMVSGDWSRHPDTVIRLEKDGKNPATKITLEKARPADPLELGVPQLLEWVTETMSYRRIQIDQHEIVSDDDLRQRIHNALQTAPEPLTMAGLQAAVTGDSKRISTLTKTAIDQGQIRNISTHKGRFSLTLPPLGAQHDTENTDKTSDPAQTRMDTDDLLGEHPTPSSPASEDPGTDGDLLGAPPAPVRGHRVADTDKTHDQDEEPGPRTTFDDDAPGPTS